jgi:hypothetical protein
MNVGIGNEELGNGIFGTVQKNITAFRILHNIFEKEILSREFSPLDEQNLSDQSF